MTRGKGLNFLPAGAAALVGWASAARAEPAGDAGAIAGNLSGAEVIGQVSLSLLLVVGVLLLLAWGMRRLNRFQTAGALDLRVLGALTLGAREKILLVEAGETRLLVGVSPGGLRTLHVFPGDAPAEAGAGAATEAGAPLRFGGRA
jgi:flagellar protein FliO/FliZ